MKWLKRMYLLMFSGFLILPIIVIFGVSFNEKKFISFPPKSYSLNWYSELFFSDEWSQALLNSVFVAMASAILAVLLAAPIAYLLWRKGVFYARFLFSLGVAPFILPPVILALAMMLLFTELNMNGWVINVILAHAIFLLALPLVSLSLGFEGIDHNLLEASQILGADAKTTLRRVVLPLMVPYLFASFSFCFVLSLNEYIIALMTVGFTLETLPIKIFNALRYGYTPVIAAAAIFFMLVNIVVFSLIAKFSNLPHILGARE